MTFETAAVDSVRLAYTRVILRLDHCENTFGVLPCTASAPAGDECYNTFSNCQDEPNFNKTTKDYIFSAQDNVIIQDNEPVYNCLVSVNTAPAKLTPGKGLGAKNTVTIRLQDFADDDLLTDDYNETRNYIARENGTFFGKLLARNVFYIGRPVIVQYGLIKNGVIETIEYEYIIDRIELGKKGVVTIQGRDVLGKTEGLKAQAPQPTTGQLVADITDASVSFTVGADELTQYPDGLIYCAVNSEVIYCNKAGGVFNIITRGVQSDQDGHSAGDEVQLCLFYDNVTPDLILADLLTVYADIDPVYIPFADWAAEVDLWLGGFSFTRIIPEPTAVQDLINEMLEETISNLWFEPSEKLINFRVDSPVLPQEYEPRVLTDQENFILDTVTAKNQDDERFSQIWIYTGRQDITTDPDKATNYTVATIRSDIESEGANQYNQSRIKRIFGKWIVSEAQAAQIASRLLTRYKVAPIEIKATFDIKDIDQKNNIHFLMESKRIQGLSGENLQTEVVITSTDYDPKTQQIKITGLSFNWVRGLTYAVVNRDDAPDYAAATVADRVRGYICDSITLKMSNGDDPYLIL